MKIKKGEFKIKPTFASIKSIADYVQKVVYPFEVNAISRGLKIFIALRSEICFKI
jgi:hypothetical protein